MQDKILNMLMQEEEITWQSIILDLIKSGELNPWDIDISVLTSKYIEIIRKMQEANLFISAKVLLASALLLKIKSEKLLTEGIAAIDFYLYPPEDIEELDDFTNKNKKRIELETTPRLTIKTPMPRKRRITVNDLIGALEKALEVNERKILRKVQRDIPPSNLAVPERKMDISLVIRDLYTKMKDIFLKKPKIIFTELVPSEKKEDKIMTFIPLLYLTTQEKVDMEQQEHFGEIYIQLHREVFEN